MYKIFLDINNKKYINLIVKLRKIRQKTIGKEEILMESKYNKSLFDRSNNQANPSSLHQVKYKQIWQCKKCWRSYEERNSHPWQIRVKISKVLPNENWQRSNNTENTYKLEPLLFNFTGYITSSSPTSTKTLYICTRKTHSRRFLQCIF